MKKSSTLIIMAFAAISVGAIGCQSSSKEKLEDAKSDVVEANKDLKDAKEEYLVDMEAFKKETNLKIAANEQSISEFKAKKTSIKNELKADYDKKINELEQKNADMKRKLNSYNKEGKDNWESFKIEFTRDMEELGKALKNLTVTNSK